MDFALSDDQIALRSAVRDLIKAHADLTVVRSVVDEASADPESAGDPPGLWGRMVEQGWLALTVPEERDGLGLGLVDASVIVRELGAGVVPAPFVPATLAVRALLAAGDTETLGAVIDGSARITTAIWRPDSAATVLGEGVTASGGRLSGRLGQVEYAHVSDKIVIADETGALWLADVSDPGITLVRTGVLDGTTRTSDVTLSGVAATPLPGATAEDLRLAALALHANDLAGIARAAISQTDVYLKTREQFGKPIGTFQALQHRMADLLVSVTMAEHVSLYAAHALDAGLPDAALAASIAKAKTSDAALEATKLMIQFHGGIGYTWEHDAHFYFKRALRLGALLGDGPAHRELVAEAVVAA